MSILEGFCGPAYTTRSKLANCERCVNLYLEVNESPSAKGKRTLYQTPGLAQFTNFGGLSVRAANSVLQGTAGERAFSVSGANFYEFFADGSNVSRGVIVEDTAAAHIACSNVEVLICSAGHVYLFTLATNAFVEVSTDGTTQLQGPVSKVRYSDGYFIAQLKDSDRFQISGLFDGNIWNPLDFAVVSYVPDNTIGFEVDHREIWMFTPKQTVPFYDSGNGDFPYDPVPGAFIEQGIGAPDSIVKVDNSMLWIAGDERGSRMAFRANGYTPVRVSDFGVEFAWASYSTVADAIGYSYQENGHNFWVLYFPTANKTWVMDLSNNTWHERESLLNGQYGAHLSRCHVFAFGKTLVGDWNSGKMYEMSLSILTDNGNEKRWLRRSPHIADERNFIFINRVEFDIETGGMPQPPLIDGDGNPRPVRAMFRWSRDGGNNYSNEYFLDCGLPGEYGKRIFKNRLGRGRDFVFELSGTDPVPMPITGAYIEAAK